MKLSTVQFLALFTFVATAIATPAHLDRRGDGGLKALCSTNDHHCVYAQGKDVTVDLTSCLGCDSKGTTCVFPSTASTSASCPNGGWVSISFGDSQSSFSVGGDISAYFSSHDHDTTANTSDSAGDDVHVRCGGSDSKESKHKSYGGESSYGGGSTSYGGDGSSYGGDSTSNGGGSSGSSGYGGGYGNK